MAHEIDMSNGRANVFVAGQAAWHRLGKVVAGAETSAEAIQLAGLAWDVEKWALQATTPDGRTVAVPNQHAIARRDTGAVLGVVGDWYQPLQNSQAFDFMDAIVGDRLAMFETAGSLRGGRQVWMLARIPRELRAAGDDVVHPYVLLTNSHDGSGACRIIPTTVRVVCQNTLHLALRGAETFQGMSIVHTQSLMGRVAMARQKLGVVLTKVDQFEQQIQALARRQMNTAELSDYFTRLVAKRAEKQQTKVLEAFLDNFHNDRQNLPGVRGSAWAAYNAVSEWADHSIGVRGSGEAERLEGRLNSMWFGNGNLMKQDAFAAALALAS